MQEAKITQFTIPILLLMLGSAVAGAAFEGRTIRKNLEVKTVEVIKEVSIENDVYEKHIEELNKKIQFLEEKPCIERYGVIKDTWNGAKKGDIVRWNGVVFFKCTFAEDRMFNESYCVNFDKIEFNKEEIKNEEFFRPIKPTK